MQDFLEKYRGNFGSLTKPLSLDNNNSYLSVLEQVFEYLRNQILTGVLLSGQRLSPEDIAMELGINHSAAREALLKLKADRLLDYHPSKGFTVVSFTLDDLREIYYLRIVFEGAACQLAAKNLSDAELSQLEHLCKKMEKCLEENDLAEMSNLNVRFHETIYAAAKLPRLYESIVKLWNGYLKSSFGYLTLRAPIMVKEHYAIYESLLSRDPQRAAQSLQDHLTSALGDLTEYWGQILNA